MTKQYTAIPKIKECDGVPAHRRHRPIALVRRIKEPTVLSATISRFHSLDTRRSQPE
ncbi:hypothetical protein [Nostoc sp. NMS8]|uniref:hypothetical protein n=1 Tax=Nostoc sp. NMS8 TaxID=2815392 RepID=UPI0025E434BD|nr:hypothetical protein [Nostoc sp. NMS8]MBN3963023.1 hypothetical protein [Nostoc sp. NMS8]